MKPETRPQLRLGGPYRNERQKREPACKAQRTAGGKRAWRTGGRRPQARCEPSGGVLGDARVYLKVSVLVEAGEAVRHFAAFTPPQDDALRFAPSLPRHPPPPCFHASSHAHRARAAGSGGGREDIGGVLGGRVQERVPTGIPKAQAPCGPGGGTFPTPLGFTPGPERPQWAAHARSRRSAASASGGKDQRGRACVRLGSVHFFP